MVKEIFGATIQGEGSATGSVVNFLRFSGCNMWDGRPETKAASQCPFCDTDFRGGDRLSAIEIVDKIKALNNVKNLVISGGEPLLQLDHFLITELKANGFIIHVESNGTREAPAGIDHLTISPKRPRNETKAINATDLKLLYPPIKSGLAPEDWLDYPAENKYLQPVDGPDIDANVQFTLDKLYELGGDWKLSLQVHKIIAVK